MIYLQRGWAAPNMARPESAAASLGLFAGCAASSEHTGDAFLAQIAPGQTRTQRGWRAVRSPSGFPVLIVGWIDNAAELSRDLGVTGPPERIYGAAVERWGDDADARVVGEYAAAMILHEGSVRLSRSPWSGFPLFFHNSAEVLLAASIPRPMFAAGLPKTLRPAALEALAAFELPDRTHALFEGIEMVAAGSVVHLSPGRTRRNAWYDPAAIPRVRFRRDEDYVEAAQEKLAASVAATLAMAKRPCIAMSGGLDSPIVGAEVLRELPGDRRLPGITFVPLPDWDERSDPFMFASDRPNVEAFARMHPRLDMTFVDNRGIGFDDRADKLFLACDAGYPAAVVGSVHHGVLDEARAQGCDVMISAAMGNMTFSTEAPWAPAEFLRTGRLGQLRRLLASRPMDTRPMWRRLLAHGVLPNLPDGWQDPVRAAIHGRDAPSRGANRYIRADSHLAARRPYGSNDGQPPPLDYFRSQRRFARSLHDVIWLGGEVGHGYEQVFGVRVRDVTAQRPFIEFCMGLPTTQFVRDGETRWLARRMARGIMPEAQRTERRHGEHNTDWHTRMTPRLDELREEVRLIEQHPQLGGWIDTARMRRDLDAWPAATPTDPEVVERLQRSLAATIYVRRFADYAMGRNPR